MPLSKNLPFSVNAESAEEAVALSEELTVSQRVQLNSALSYHALKNPGSKIRSVIAIGTITQVPALTDNSTNNNGAVDGLEVRYELVVCSTSRGVSGKQEITRFIRLSHPDASPATTRPPEKFSLPRMVYRELEKRRPIALDSVREFLMKRRERTIAGRIPRYPKGEHDTALERAFTGWGKIPRNAPSDVPRAVLFGLHWLQTGGAERWAFESIQLAKEAGLLPVVITDQNSVHPWADRHELKDCVIITLSFDGHERNLDVAFGHALLENFNFVGVMLHHSHYLYQMLPWVMKHRPELPVVNSLHIVEYLGGGYPGIAVHFDEFIDTHHVISPQLVRWMSEEQGVLRKKLVLAPLTTLTVNESDAMSRVKQRDSSVPLTLAFVGRLSRQKRPDVFLSLVKALHKSGFPFRAILHGDGEMRSIVDGLITQMNLNGVIEQRFEDVPVSETLTESDVLVITSLNEGLTLTTFEAVAAGVPVISTDVGSQQTIVQGEALFPRPAKPFISGASALIRRLDDDECLREQIWAGQRDRIIEFSALPTAHDWMKEQFAAWQK